MKYAIYTEIDGKRTPKLRTPRLGDAASALALTVARIFAKCREADGQRIVAELLVAFDAVSLPWGEEPGKYGKLTLQLYPGCAAVMVGARDEDLLPDNDEKSVAFYPRGSESNGDFDA